MGDRDATGASSRATRLFGTEQPVPEAITVRAGPLSATLTGGALRDIRWHGALVVREIAYLVRDIGWGTVPATIGPAEFTGNDTAFHVRFAAELDSGGIRMIWRAEIDGGADGVLTFRAEAETFVAFQTNRCGFVVLHPADRVAGTPVRIEHTSGTIEEGVFPARISPGQPCFDIRALTSRLLDGVQVECRFEADLPLDPHGRFEMEDQRNWTDNSFKTYAGSLLDPFPYALAPGRPWRQRITVRAAGEPAPWRGGDHATADLVPSGHALPLYGVGLHPDQTALAEQRLPLVRALGARHLTAWFALGDAASEAALPACRRIAEAAGAGVQLELVLPCREPPDVELARAAALCRGAGLAPAAVLPCPAAYLRSYQPSARWPVVPEPGAMYAEARKAFPGARIGGGMLTYFTELNRKPPPPGAIDFVSHTTSPLVHAADDDSVMDTLRALPAIATHLREGPLGAVGYRVGPSSLGMRTNPYGAGTAPNPRGERVAMTDADPRQRGLFGAAWTVGYAAAFAPFPLEALALHHLGGASGLFAEPPHAVYPVWHVLRFLCRMAGAPGLIMTTGPTVGLGARIGAGRVLLAANVTGSPASVSLPSETSGRLLDAESFLAACEDPFWLDRAPATRMGKTITLDAYAVAFLSLDD